MSEFRRLLGLVLEAQHYIGVLQGQGRHGWRDPEFVQAREARDAAVADLTAHVEKMRRA